MTTKTSRLSFEIVEYHFEMLNKLATSGSDFAKMWTRYLKGSGWQEEDYEDEVTRRMYSKAN